MRSDRERFADILEAIVKIERYIPRGRQVFETDEIRPLKEQIQTAMQNF